MTYKFWNGSEWVRCSQEEAARRRSLGQRIMERRETTHQMSVTAPPPAPPAPTAPALDALTDEDLERLTAPEVGADGGDRLV